jgi:GT2 family glycosyltransferase
MIVAIPYAGNALDLAVLLTQLQMQEVLPTSIYLADNSKDGSGVMIAERYHWKVPIATQRNVGGIHQSWNAAIRYAKEEDIVIVNDDIMISRDFVSVMSAYMKSGEAAMYCPANAGFPPAGKIRKGYTWSNDNNLEYYFLDHEQYVLPPSITGWCMGIPHETIESIGIFDENLTLYFGDKDYEKRIFTAGKRACFIKGLFVQHFGSSSTRRIKKKNHNKIYKHDEAIYKKKWGIV